MAKAKAKADILLLHEPSERDRSAEDARVIILPIPLGVRCGLKYNVWCIATPSSSCSAWA
jgi:hypothetical protein